jgi:hypothetical protein
MEIPKWLHEVVCRKRPQLWPTNWISTMPMLQLTGHSLQSSFWAKNWLLEWNTHPLTLTWLWIASSCFQKLSLPWRDEDFRIMKTSKKKVMALKAIPQQGFQKCFQQWQHCWAKRIAAEGEYLEGDPSH